MNGSESPKGGEDSYLKKKNVHSPKKSRAQSGDNGQGEDVRIAGTKGEGELTVSQNSL